jgi:hypothetical protein
MTGKTICDFLEKEPRQFNLCIIDQIYCRTVPEHSVYLENACLDLDRCVFEVIHFQTVSMSSLTVNSFHHPRCEQIKLPLMEKSTQLSLHIGKAGEIALFRRFYVGGRLNAL